MPTCATRNKIADAIPVCNLILPVPDTDFRDFLDEVEELAGFAPEIIDAIEKDLDAHGRQKKKPRLEDRRFFEGRTAELPELNMQELDILATELKRYPSDSVAAEDSGKNVADARARHSRASTEFNEMVAPLGEGLIARDWPGEVIGTVIK